jgi:hypothetical protein
MSQTFSRQRQLVLPREGPPPARNSIMTSSFFALILISPYFSTFTTLSTLLHWQHRRRILSWTDSSPTKASCHRILAPGRSSKDLERRFFALCASKELQSALNVRKALLRLKSAHRTMATWRILAMSSVRGRRGEIVVKSGTPLGSRSRKVLSL